MFFSFQPLTEFKFSYGLGRVEESGSDIRSSPRRLESPVVNVPRSKEQREMQGRGCQVGEQTGYDWNISGQPG